MPLNNSLVVNLIRDEIKQVREQTKDIRDELELIQADVHKLLQFKWQVVGGAMVASAIGTFVFQALIHVFK